MEIDFLGLNSPRCELEQEKSQNPYLDAGGGADISLSLSTTSSLERKKWEFGGCKKIISKTEQQVPSTVLVAPPAFRHSAGGFLYDLNYRLASVNLRDMSQLSNEASASASLAMLYPTCPNVFAFISHAISYVSQCFCPTRKGGSYSDGVDGSESNLGQILGEEVTQNESGESIPRQPPLEHQKRP